MKESPDSRSERQLSDMAIDVTIPRECIYQQGSSPAIACPRCSTPLVRSFQSYLIATCYGRAITDSFVIGNDAGWFCPRCPTVVIDKMEIGRLLGLRQSVGDVGQEFAVMGLVDLAAIPPEKQHVPIGNDDSPIPFVEFTVKSGSASSRAVAVTPLGRRAQRKKRRR